MNKDIAISAFKKAIDYVEGQTNKTNIALTLK
jgi:hypothetical protein